MKTNSNYYPLLEPLLSKPTFTTAEAQDVGVPRHALAYLEKAGAIERVVKGGGYRDPCYESELEFTKEDLALAAYTIPNAVVCLISAYSFSNDMTTALEHSFFVIYREMRLDPAQLWQNLGLERFLVRLTKSEYAPHFILKGGVLLSHSG